MRVLVGQFGGPTAVLNASLYGVLSGLARPGVVALGVRGGGQGLMAGDLTPLSGEPPVWLRTTPGAALGSGRHRPDAGDDERLARVAARVDGAVLIGGNGTMALARRLAESANGRLPVVGVPKTIDNDLFGTDHAPGYPSAARFVTTTVRDLATDLRAMAGFEDVRLIEVMGRNAGWLTAAAVLARRHAHDLPQIVLLPELPLDPDALCEAVAEHHRRDGSVLVVVGEGVRDAAGTPLGLQPTDAAGQTQVLGGAAAALAHSLRTRLGLRVRAESLGFLPRCLSAAATAADRAEAEALGRAAAEAVLAGRGGFMVGWPDRSAGDAATVGATVPSETPLADIAGRDRPIPPELMDLGGTFRAWLLPLVSPLPAWSPDRL